MNLRDLMRIEIPRIEPAEAALFEHCAGWLERYPRDLPPTPWTLIAQRAHHTGRPLPGDDLCRGWPAGEPGTATGFVTVDAMHDCTPGWFTPGDFGPIYADREYFRPDGTGLAANRNVLWGDVFHVDPAGDSAQGVAAVSLRAEAGRFTWDDSTFYSCLGGPCSQDGREPLASTYRARFLLGGPFAAATDVILWLDPWSALPRYALGSGFVCADPDLIDPLGQGCARLTIQVYDERGNAVGEPTVLVDEELFPLVRKLRLGEELPVPVAAGFLEVRREQYPNCEDPGPLGPIPIPGVPQPPQAWIPSQAWIAPVIRADGRYSLAVEAAPLDSLCPGPAPAAP